MIMINPLKCLFGIKGHVALDRNLGLGYNTLLLRLIPADLLSACLHRQFHTLPGLLDTRAALLTPTLTHECQAGRQFVPFYDGLWYDQAWAQTCNLPHLMLTSLRPHQPDTVYMRDLQIHMSMQR